MQSYCPQLLTRKWALVTGSSGGIGSAIARELAAAGANLILHTWDNRQVAENLAHKLCQQGTKTEVLACDLGDATARDEFCTAAWRIAPLDILVNNAGADVLTGEAANRSFAEKLQQLWRVDVEASIHLGHDLGHRMQARGAGSIVNIGWDQAEHGMAGDSGEMFAATKGAVMAFTRSLARTLAPQVRVNCVAPGWIRTRWGEQAADYWQDRAKKESLLGRWGVPDDVARAVCFLASPAAEFITGQILAVNGGRSGFPPSDR